MIQQLGLIGAVAMPFWNILLIMKIQQRKSSRDISLSWALGVFACIVLMLPSAILSTDQVFKAFGIINTALFGLVVIQVLRYR